VIPLTVPDLDETAIKAAERVLRSGMLVQGKEVAAFEQALAARCGRKHAVAVSSGTAALELALRALGIGAGDGVLVPALTWPSPAHAARTIGARPQLVDVDPSEWNSRGKHFAGAVNDSTRAAIVIEQFGNPARHAEIVDALGDLPVIVDAACALGSEIHGAPCGSHGAIACMSFHPRKILTTGEGGACLTDDDALAAQLRALRNHGQQGPGDFLCASGNYRMTEMAAAMGSAQLAVLGPLIAQRRALAERYRSELPELELQQAPDGARVNHQTFGVLVGEPGGGSEARNSAISALRERDVQAGALSYALQDLPQFTAEAEDAKKAGRALDVARDIAARGMALPLFPTMSAAQFAQVVEAVRQVSGR